MKFDPMHVATINNAADEMVKLANEHGEQVVADLNGIEIIASPGGNARAIVDYYYEELHKRHEAWLNSSKGRR